ncbi:MAG: type II/IV secretion system ATPase subunit, partial [Thermoplasmatota archaeon]
GRGSTNVLQKEIDEIIADYGLLLSDFSKEKIRYAIQKNLLGFGKINSLMQDPNIEDISCDGAGLPLFLYHREHGSIQSNVQFNDEDELSGFVMRLAQKSGKHISIAHPMIDATMPDGSRIQMTLSTEVSTKGSTFTIRKFREQPFSPADLIRFNSFSSEMIAYFWLAVEHGVNGLIAGGTAAGKTSTLNALALFIPRESKIVSIEETREINLPHPNWIPGVSRSGFGDVVAGKMAGEIDLYDLMKAALRQRPEYILVGEIRGREAYVLFQAMATGHTTYSTVHADSVKALVHRLEGKPINIPRSMLQSLDIVLIQASVKVEGKQVRRVRQIVELLNVDAETQEVLTNTAFTWDSSEDSFAYSGKSYILEQVRTQLDLSAEEMLEEVNQRRTILEWMHKYDIHEFMNVAKIVTAYTENPDELLHEIKMNPEKAAQFSVDDTIQQKESLKDNNKLDTEKNPSLSVDEKEKSVFSSVKNLFSTRKKKKKNPSKGG